MAHRRQRRAIAPRRRVAQQELAAAVGGGEPAPLHRQAIEIGLDHVQQPIDQVGPVGGRLDFGPADDAFDKGRRVDLSGTEQGHGTSSRS
jgi:hypothetical protein